MHIRAYVSNCEEGGDSAGTTYVSAVNTMANAREKNRMKITTNVGQKRNPYEKEQRGRQESSATRKARTNRQTKTRDKSESEARTTTTS